MDIYGWIFLLLPFAIWWWVGTGGIFLAGCAKYDRFRNNNQRSREWLIKQIGNAKGEVLIIAGNLNPYVYNEVADAIRQRLMSGNGVQIRVLAGCKILTDEKGRNGIFELAKENSFQNNLVVDFLRFRPVQHFRVIDRKHLFLEDPHPEGVENRRAQSLENSFFKAWLYKRQFHEIWDSAERVSISEVKQTPIKDLEGTR